jgi:hypothetical protein
VSRGIRATDRPSPHRMVNKTTTYTMGPGYDAYMIAQAPGPVWGLVNLVIRMWPGHQHLKSSCCVPFTHIFAFSQIFFGLSIPPNSFCLHPWLLSSWVEAS